MPVGFLVWGFVNFAFGDTTVTNGILSVSPTSATQGVSGLLVTFNLDPSAAPPAPPSNVPPSSVMISNISGSFAAHVSQYVVTAQFTIPLGSPTGLCSVAVTFPNPTATNVTYLRQQAFLIVAGSGVAAGFSGSPKYGAPPLLVAFTNTSSGSITNQLWNFGDSTTSTNLNPTHAYTTTGVFTVSLTVFGAGGSNTLTRAAYITVTTNIGEYLIVDTGQTNCFNTNSVIAAPSPGQSYYGQDAQFFGNQSSYTLSGDGKTVRDNNTGLTWQNSFATNSDGSVNKMTLAQAETNITALNAANYGGYNDWRLPTIKELYSLITFAGIDPSGYTGTNTALLTPFIDRTYFHFAYGSTNNGGRIIDMNYASSTPYVYHTMANSPAQFGVNFADGRIKGYSLDMSWSGPGVSAFPVQFVRGAVYGENDFVENGDSTITDRSTGLMWTKGDSGKGLNWQEALAWAQTKNAENYLGHSDWRLPNTKELQSIVDYTRSPDTTSSAAIDPRFTCTGITNEAGNADFPFYWTSTTHMSVNGSDASAFSGGYAVYVAFGRAMGFMTGGDTNIAGWLDVHGAGAQRSDPKVGNPADYPQGHGPQGDAIRIYNYVRLVRGGNNSGVDHVGDGIPDWWRRQYFGGAGTTTNAVSCSTSDTDLDGMSVLQEYLADTNPTNNSSRLAIIGIASQTNGTQLSWIGGTRVTQVVESRRDLAATNDSWTGIATNIPPTAITNVLFRSGETATNLFWRIRTWR